MTSLQLAYIELSPIPIIIIYVFVKTQIENYIEAKRFRKSLDAMIKRRNSEFSYIFSLAIKESLDNPKVKETISNLLNNRCVGFEKHLWIKMANGRVCEQCGKSVKHFK